MSNNAPARTTPVGLYYFPRKPVPPLKIRDRRARPERAGGYRARTKRPPAGFSTLCHTERPDIGPRIEALAAMYAAAEACGSEFLARRQGLPTTAGDLPWGIDLE